MEKEIVSTQAKIEERIKNKALVSYVEGEETKKVVARIKKKNIKNNNITLYKTSKINNAQNILLIFMPLILFLIGFGFGFLFKNQVYHYILSASIAIVGFIIAVVIKLIFNKFAKKAYFCE